MNKKALSAVFAVILSSAISNYASASDGYPLARIIQMIRSSDESERVVGLAELEPLIGPYSLAHPDRVLKGQPIQTPSSVIDFISTSILTEKSLKARWLETIILGRVQPTKTVLTLLYRLEESDAEPTIRGTASYAIGFSAKLQNAQDADESLKRLMKSAKQDRIPGCRVEAVLAIGMFQTKTNLTVPFLESMLSDPQKGVASAAADALQSLGSKSAPSLSTLMKLAEENGDPNRSAEAIMTIGAMGDAAKPALNMLIKDACLNDRNLCAAAMQSLWSLSEKIDLQPYLPKFVKILNNPVNANDLSTYAILIRMGSKADSVKNEMNTWAMSHSSDAAAIRKRAGL